MNLKSELSLKKMSAGELSPFNAAEIIADHVEKMKSELESLRNRVEKLEQLVAPSSQG
jgi:hypothetical protein